MAKNESKPVRVTRRGVYCPMCHEQMVKAKTKRDCTAVSPHTGEVLMEKGHPVKVCRVFWWCPKDGCHTVVWFDYRQDGKRGRLHYELEIRKALERKFGLKPGILGGKFGKIE